MSDDIVERLRARHLAWQRECSTKDESLYSWAADEIERLRAALEKALAGQEKR